MGVGKGVGVGVTQGLRAGISIFKPDSGDTGTTALSSENRASAVAICCIETHVCPIF